MQKLHLPAVLALGLAPTALASLPAYDGFDGPFRTNLHGADEGSGWASAWAELSYDVVTRRDPSAGLSFGSLAVAPGAAVTPGAIDVWPTSYYERGFGASAPTEHDLYLSFLLEPTANFGSYGGIELGTWPHRVIVGSPIGSYTYGMHVGDAFITMSNVPLVQGETVFLVLHLSTNAANTQTTFRLYVNPDPAATEPAVPDVIHTASWGLMPSILRLDNGSGFVTDEIRLARTWDEVTPVVPPCPADLDGDGAVAFADLLAVLAAWGPCDACPEDLTANGSVDFADVLDLLSSWGPCP